MTSGKKSKRILPTISFKVKQLLFAQWPESQTHLTLTREAKWAAKTHGYTNLAAFNTGAPWGGEPVPQLALVLTAAETDPPYNCCHMKGPASLLFTKLYRLLAAKKLLVC